MLNKKLLFMLVLQLFIHLIKLIKLSIPIIVLLSIQMLQIIEIIKCHFLKDFHQTDMSSIRSNHFYD
jgi:hypothetical protein